MEYEHPGLIRYRLEKEGDREVLFQVLSQNEGTQNQKNIGGIQFKSEGFMSVGSSYSPELTPSTIWLRGSIFDEDEAICHYLRASYTDREQYYSKIVLAIDAWSKLERWAPLLGNLHPKQEQLSFWD